MIEKILIRDFQCHKRIDIEFDPFISTITGVSDSGKTTILRALRWVSTNQPSGSDFIGGFGRAGLASVKLKVDGKSIERRRGGEENSYRLKNRILRAFGQGTPQPIRDILNLGEVNWSFQFDGPYWLMLSPAEVSRQLNAIINLGAIDSALEGIGKAVRRAKAAVQVSEERLLNARTVRKSLDWVKEADRDLKALEGLERELEDARQSHRMARLRFGELEARVQAVQEGSERLEALSRVVEVGQELQEISERNNRLFSIAGQWERAEHSLSNPLPNLKKLEQLYSSFQETAERKRKLESLVAGIENLQYQIDFRSLEIKSIEDQIEQGTEGICPICLRPLDR